MKPTPTSKPRPRLSETGQAEAEARFQRRAAALRRNLVRRKFGPGEKTAETTKPEAR
ncbi:MAG: hypothetical protein ABT940_04925 [Alphaproteobacteria bacterium]